jgi:hypothetical protein
MQLIGHKQSHRCPSREHRCSFAPPHGPRLNPPTKRVKEAVGEGRKSRSSSPAQSGNTPTPVLMPPRRAQEALPWPASSASASGRVNEVKRKKTFPSNIRVEMEERAKEDHSSTAEAVSRAVIKQFLRLPKRGKPTQRQWYALALNVQTLVSNTDLKVDLVSVGAAQDGASWSGDATGP